MLNTKISKSLFQVSPNNLGHVKMDEYNTLSIYSLDFYIITSTPYAYVGYEQIKTRVKIKISQQ